MKIVIVGCGRVGSVLAEIFDRAGHQVVIVDLTARAFDRLPSDFRGSAVRGNGTDEDVLRRAGAQDADIFLALTEGDNRNIMATQVAVEHLGAKRVVAKVNDPVRAAAYADLGIPALCRTNILVDGLLAFLDQPVEARPAVISPPAEHAATDGHHHHASAPAAAREA
jgi:trk system potassium uptake protein TrkA